MGVSTAGALAVNAAGLRIPSLLGAGAKFPTGASGAAFAATDCFAGAGALAAPLEDACIVAGCTSSAEEDCAAPVEKLGLPKVGSKSATFPVASAARCSADAIGPAAFEIGCQGYSFFLPAFASAWGAGWLTGVAS